MEKRFVWRFVTCRLFTVLDSSFLKQSSAQSAVKETERIFIQMIQSIESLCSELTEMINVKEQMELDEAHGFMEKLEQEIVEMKRRDAKYDQLLHLDDKSQFLKVTSVAVTSIKYFFSFLLKEFVLSFQNYEPLRGLPRLEIPPAVLVNPDFSFELVSRKATDLGDDIKDLCQKKSEKLAKNGEAMSEYSTCCTKTGQRGFRIYNFYSFNSTLYEEHSWLKVMSNGYICLLLTYFFTKCVFGVGIMLHSVTECKLKISFGKNLREKNI